MSEIPLELVNVTKKFGAFKAVDRLSMTVPSGKIVGFLGPNGAGKSTSLRMALGVMNPDAGEARLFGAPPDVRGASARWFPAGRTRPLQEDEPALQYRSFCPSQGHDKQGCTRPR